MVGQDARGDSHQPRGKRHAPPLELSDPGKSFAEDIGRQILGLVTVADPPDDVGVDAIKVLLVQVGKAGRVALGGLDLGPFVLLITHRQLLINIIRPADEKVTVHQYIICASQGSESSLRATEMRQTCSAASKAASTVNNSPKATIATAQSLSRRICPVVAPLHDPMCLVRSTP